MTGAEGPYFVQEGRSYMRDAIGIDPDSKGFICAHVKASSGLVKTRGYLATEADLGKFVKWVKGEGEVIVAIEGSNGLSKPLEKALREAGVVFHSFKPADTDKFRKAVLGQNKDNEKDAESVARYAMALEAQGKLDRYRRVWFADAELQLLTRGYERKSQAMTAEVNRLWKLIRHASSELYLALGGNHPEVEVRENMLNSQGILTLLGQQPNLGEWKDLSDEEFLAAMGGDRKGRRELIQQLRKVAGDFTAVTPAMALMIQDSARTIQRLKRDESDIRKMLDEITKDSPAVQALKEKRGIGTVTAATMVAEIIDIRRFGREDNLAGYMGLGMRKYSTGDTTRMVTSQLFNHRLKDAFMTAARNYVRFNPGSHLEGYYRNLVKAGMTPLEATKRGARALVRVIFRELYALEGTEANPLEVGEAKEGKSDVANGVTRSEQSHSSDTSPSSLGSKKAPRTSKVKVSNTRSLRTTRRRKAVSKKTA
jgi:transposase